MTSQEFADITQSCIVDQWGSMTQAMLQKLWLMCRELTAGEVRSALDAMALTHHKMPMLGQMRSALLPALQRGATERRRARLETLPKCELCLNSGWIQAVQIDNPISEFAFLCNCAAVGILGLQESRGAIRWNTSHEEKYYRRTYSGSEMIDLGEARQSFNAVALINSAKTLSIKGRNE